MCGHVSASSLTDCYSSFNAVVPYIHLIDLGLDLDQLEENGKEAPATLKTRRTWPTTVVITQLEGSTVAIMNLEFPLYYL